MKTFLRCLLLLALAVAVTGCASGPKFGEFQQSIAPLKPDTGRVFFYRSSILGAAIQPDIKLNGTIIGKAVPQAFFFVDLAPGEYKVVTTTEVKRTLSFTLDAGQTRYVRMNISMGLVMGHVYGELVDEKIWTKGIKDCKYNGPKADMPGK